MVGLQRSGVPFRKPYREPQCAGWEGPFGPEVTRFPCHPKTREKQRAASARRRERQRELGIEVAPRRAASARLSDEERRVENADKQRRWRERRRMAGLSLDVRRDTPERREYVRQAQARWRERQRQAKIAAE